MVGQQFSQDENYRLNQKYQNIFVLGLKFLDNPQ